MLEPFVESICFPQTVRRMVIVGDGFLSLSIPIRMRACLDLHGRADAGWELPGRWQLLSPLGVQVSTRKVK
jgi:hypothetical protein